MGSIDDHGGWSGVLGRLLDGDDIGAEAAAAALGTVLDGAATPAQTAAFLVALRAKGESASEMTGLVDAMVDHAVPVPIDPDGVVDTCGTGGDRLRTVNISTMAALVVAGAGVTVCKHGNRAASSASGSADVLEALGVAIDLDAEGVARSIATAGIGFCFAPNFHPAMRHVGPIRRELGVPTVFNFLGPLANPARVRRQVVGVSDARMVDRMMEVLSTRGADHIWVVHGASGLDELSTSGPSQVVEYREGRTLRFEVDPEALGLRPAPVDALVGGDASHNAKRTRAVLAGEPGPQRDVVLLNAAAVLVVAGATDTLEAGLEQAAAAVDDGSATAALDRLVAVTAG